VGTWDAEGRQGVGRAPPPDRCDSGASTTLPQHHSGHVSPPTRWQTCRLRGGLLGMPPAGLEPATRCLEGSAERRRRVASGHDSRSQSGIRRSTRPPIPARGGCNVRRMFGTGGKPSCRLRLHGQRLTLAVAGAAGRPRPFPRPRRNRALWALPVLYILRAYIPTSTCKTAWCPPVIGDPAEGAGYPRNTTWRTGRQ
jgi:hypothetical protein